MEKKIVEVLKELNIPMGNLGFTYLRTAIKEVVLDEEKLRSMTKVGGLYDIVAKEHHSTPSRTERAIRHAIETSFAEASETVLIKYLGSTKGKLTNKNFIAALAYEIKSEGVSE